MKRSAKAESSDSKGRSNNFSYEEVEAMRDAVSANARKIFNKDCTNLEKKYALSKVHAEVLKVSTFGRSFESVRNKVRADLAAAKTKKAKIRQSYLKTGGGTDEKVPVLSPYEDLITSFMPDEQMLGLPDGIDTSREKTLSSETPKTKDLHPKSPETFEFYEFDRGTVKMVQEEFEALGADDQDSSSCNEDSETGGKNPLSMTSIEHGKDADVIPIAESKVEPMNCVEPILIDDDEIEVAASKKKSSEVKGQPKLQGKAKLLADNPKEVTPAKKKKYDGNQSASQKKVGQITPQLVYEQQERMIDAVNNQTTLLDDVFQYLKSKFD